MIEALLAGVLLGFSAGIAPGPLLALVIAETLRHDVWAGIKVALAPLITDLPIVVGALLLVSRLGDFDTALGIVSLLGGCFVAYLGVESIRTRGLELDEQPAKPRSLSRGVITNFLSPHPYLFWLTVGAPTTLKAHGDGGGVWAAAFIAGFYLLLIGSKLTLAVVSARSRTVLTGRVYLTTMRVLGVLLCGFALLLFRDGAVFLGLLGA